ncbi:putative small G-protein Ras2 [Xylariaceae sp. FL0255]|nr:putative small G-protein Ras2 [Xylariaceae sp. FL0255]
MPPPIHIRVCLLGPGGVGKSSLTVRVLRDHFEERYDPTIEDLFQKTITIDGQPVLLELLDTAGQEEYETFRDEWIRQSHGAVVVYDVTRKASFKKVEPLIEQVIKVKEWRSDTAHHQLDATTVVEDKKTETLSPRLPIIVVGNKVDLLEAREVGEKRGYEVANEHSCMFIEASAKMSINVEKAIYDVVKVAVSLKQKGYDNAPSTWNSAWETLIQRPETNDSSDKYRGCCNFM